MRQYKNKIIIFRLILLVRMAFLKLARKSCLQIIKCYQQVIYRVLTSKMPQKSRISHIPQKAKSYLSFQEVILSSNTLTLRKENIYYLFIIFYNSYFRFSHDY